MPPGRVTVRIDPGKTRVFLSGNLEPKVRRAAETTRERVRANIAKKGRSSSGLLARTIYVHRMYGSDTNPRYEVGSDLHYAIYQEEGVEGPITPKRVKWLRFRPKGSAVYVFAKETSGFRGIHMFRDALKALTVRDFLT